jgi:DNA-directed RNA polymerase specialized sigma24 family protein
MGRKRSVNYVDPLKLKEEIQKFKDAEPGTKMSDELGLMLMKIANRYSMLPNFRNYSYREDFVSDAIARMIEKIHKIDLDIPNSNPFSYLTRTCYHVYIARITKEKKFTEMKNQLTDKLFDGFESDENLNSSEK